MERIKLVAGGPEIMYGEAPASVISAGAIYGIVLTELSQLARMEGKYEHALDLVADAVRYYEGAIVHNVKDGIEKIWPDIAEDEILWQSRLEGYLTGLQVSLNDSVNLFIHLKLQGKAVEKKSSNLTAA